MTAETGNTFFEPSHFAFAKESFSCACSCGNTFFYALFPVVSADTDESVVFASTDENEENMLYRIGTRGSKLALAQAGFVRKKLAEYYTMHLFELVVIKTSGDRFSDMPMRDIGEKGIFIKEIEEKLLDGSVDLAVHSMKDMPSELPSGLVLTKPWKREDPRDVLVLREKRSLADLPGKARIATGSLRRKHQLLCIRPDLQVVDIRGNVETRIRKMKEQELDGLVLAAAGLKRLGLGAEITQYLDYGEMVSAPAQGVLAIEAEKERDDVIGLVERFADEKTVCEVIAERHFLSLMGGGCHLPVGAVGEKKENILCLKTMYGDEAGDNVVFAQAQGVDPIAVAERAAEEIRAQWRKQAENR